MPKKFSHSERLKWLSLWLRPLARFRTAASDEMAHQISCRLAVHFRILTTLFLLPFLATAAEPVVTEIGPHHKTFQRSTQEILSNGKVRNRVSGYTSMAAGLHYLTPEGQWAEAQEVIEMFQDGAIARQGQIRVNWAPNLATAGSVDLTLPGGERLRTHVLGLAFHDVATGESELVAEIKDCAGELHPPNEVHYPDAFSNVRATVRYTYGRGRFDQDVILYQRLTLPKGFNPATTQLEIWTELIAPPAPSKSVQRIGTQDDETLNWGSARMGLGRAFQLEDPQGLGWSAPMAKQLVEAEQRTFLVESIEVAVIQAQLQRLPLPPQGAALGGPQPGPRRLMARNSLGGTNQTNAGNLFLPKTAEAFTYDADGNLTSDGRWTNKWDAENRLLLAESLASGPTASKRRVVYEYDGQGRSSRRLEYDGSSGSYVLTNDIKFLRDGWQLLAEINGANGQALRSYLWGLALSGSQTGAGGVGGLLAMNSASNGVHFYAMDGNGNVVGLVAATTGTRSATHEYDPYGRTLRQTASSENAFRFSTKQSDDTLEMVSYEHRLYHPGAGRWPNRDPIGDEAFLRAQLAESDVSATTTLQEAKRPGYVFVSNDSLNRVDHFGLAQSPLTPDEVSSCQANINRALEILRKAVNLPCARCRNLFLNTPRCQNLLDRLNNLTISIDNDPNSDHCVRGRYGYTYGNDGRWQVWMCPRTCREGRWCLGATIIHELFHECNNDIGGGGHNNDAFAAESACGFNGVCR